MGVYSINYGEFVGQNRDRSVHQIYEKVGYVPNDQKSELSFTVFHSTKLFFFALDQFRINSGGVECELRASKDVTITITIKKDWRR